jgi:hypothetical protein
VAPRAEAANITFSSQGDSDTIICSDNPYKLIEKVIGKLFSFSITIIPLPYKNMFEV